MPKRKTITLDRGGWTDKYKLFCTFEFEGKHYLVTKDSANSDRVCYGGFFELRLIIVHIYHGGNDSLSNVA